MATKKTTNGKKPSDPKPNVQPGGERNGMLAAATALDQARRSGELTKATNQLLDEIRQLDAREQMEITNLQIKFDAQRQALRAQQAQLAAFL